MTIGRLIEELRKAQIDCTAIERNDPSSVEQLDTIRIDLKGIPIARSGDLRGLIRGGFPDWTLTRCNQDDCRMSLDVHRLAVLKRDTIEQTLATIQTRLRDLGVIGRAFRRPGGGSAVYEIVVQLAGRPDDPARVREILITRARLEITPVKDGPFRNREEALAKYGGTLPLASKLARAVPRPGEAAETWYLLNRAPVITGRDLRNARPGRDEFGKWEVDFILTRDGAQRFGRFTEANIGSRLAIMLDDQVLSAPSIQSRIEDSGRITGAANQQEAYDLALVLRSGSLPAGIVVLQERSRLTEPHK
ncbi:MAG: hypothetical protein ABSH05_15785 [Bryobacteraceae bacterium]